MSPPVGVGTLELPSASSAEALVAGDVGALPRVALHMGGRAVLVGTGLAVAGFRGRKLVVGALAGAAAIEAFVLLYAWWKRDKP